MVSARFLRPPGVPGSSLLEIQCESAAKARFLHAKYVSDLQELPGVTKITLPGRLRAYDVFGQGAILAARTGSRLTILAATSEAGLNSLVRLLAMPIPQPGRASHRAARLPHLRVADLQTRTEVPVPMFLDRWDRFGFRFYYRPWELPSGETDQTYNVRREFDFARQQDRSGFVFWDDEYATDTAEGLMNEVYWDWAQAAARERSLPVGINDSAGSGSTPAWLLNRYRDQTQQKMPQYVGDFYRIGDLSLGGHGVMSWDATTAEDIEMGVLQCSIRRFNSAPNVVSWLEPHGELKHGAQDILLEYGPAADATFQRFLRTRYTTLAGLGARWYGDPTHFKSWADVRVPELASFLGWGPDALDLQGAWRIGYETFAAGKSYDPGQLKNNDNSVISTVPAPSQWYDPGFDDSAWPSVIAPGDDHEAFLPKRPAVFRRSLDVPSSWIEAHPRSWLYVWDLNLGAGDRVLAYLNGSKIGDSLVRFVMPHWAAFETTGLLRPGVNQFALRLPKGILAYRVYLSSSVPTEYPNLGPGGNARWVDFSDWVQWSRVDTVRRGMEMIRQADPNRPITLMHPDEYADGVRELAEAFGGEFHNTGYMAAFYADLDPLLMQGAGLPCSLEPGGPPRTLAEYRHMMGLYHSEGIQGVDYFIHIGDVLWNPEIRAEFERTHNLVHLIGKYHAPSAEVAVLYSNRVGAITGWPWGSDPNVNLPGGYWNSNAAANLRDHYPRDGITEADFASGRASRYKVIIDTNTSIQDAALVREIERYVRAGGTFITYVQTGRHTPTVRDAWPISRLSGYRVIHVGQFGSDGQVLSGEWHKLRPAPGQSIFPPAAWQAEVRGNGLSLQKMAPECRDLLLWEDGTVAIGVRPLGKGWIVQNGVRFAGDHVFDRIEPGGNSPQVQAQTAVFSALLKWRGIPPVPGRLDSPDAEKVLLRHYLSNNGLFDFWSLWNQDTTRTVHVNLDLPGNPTALFAHDVETGLPIRAIRSGAAAVLPDLTLQPLQTRIFLTSRHDISGAARDWFLLQRSWWRGASRPVSHPLPFPPHKLSVDLSKDWSWTPLGDAEDPTALAAAPPRGARWQQMRLGIWTFPGRQAVHHGLFRRSFTMPPTWTTGRLSLWLQNWSGATFADRGRVFLDGKLLRNWSADGLAGVDLPGLKPGSIHALAVEIQSRGWASGSRGACWLWWQPDPESSIDLSGEWIPSQDLLHDDAAAAIPGAFTAYSLKRTVLIPADAARKTVELDVEGTGPLVGAFVNGHWVRRHHHMIGKHWTLNITPWIRPGEVNRLEIACWGGPAHTAISALRLDFYRPGVYP